MIECHTYLLPPCLLHLLAGSADGLVRRVILVHICTSIVIWGQVIVVLHTRCWVEEMRTGLELSEPCMQCGINVWHVPGAGDSGYCSMCCIRWTAARTRGQLAVVTAALPWQPFTVNRVVDFFAGSTAPDEVLRDRRRAALYVMLSSPGSLTRFQGWGKWDRSDHGPVQYRRDLLEKVITFLA